MIGESGACGNLMGLYVGWIAGNKASAIEITGGRGGKLCCARLLDEVRLGVFSADDTAGLFLCLLDIGTSQPKDTSQS